jgi:hypothetical protein
LGIIVALKLIPKSVIDDAREQASVIVDQSIPIGRKTTGIILSLWICGLLLILFWIFNILNNFG